MFILKHEKHEQNCNTKHTHIMWYTRRSTKLLEQIVGQNTILNDRNP
jgi:hypothetical protein